MKDFAAKKNWWDDQPKAPKKWLRWLLLLIVIVVVVAVFSLRKHSVATAPATPVAVSPVAPKIPPAPKQTVQFDFYHMLAQDQTNPAAVKPANTTTKTPATTSSYIVKLSVFHSRAAAEQYKAQLILSGVTEALTVQALKDNTYQVQAGPWNTSAEAKTVEQALLKSQVKGVVQTVN